MRTAWSVSGDTAMFQRTEDISTPVFWCFHTYTPMSGNLNLEAGCLWAGSKIDRDALELPVAIAGGVEAVAAAMFGIAARRLRLRHGRAFGEVRGGLHMRRAFAGLSLGHGWFRLNNGSMLPTLASGGRKA